MPTTTTKPAPISPSARTHRSAVRSSHAAESSPSLWSPASIIATLDSSFGTDRGSYHVDDRLSAIDGHQHYALPEHELADQQGEGGSIAPRSGLYVERGDDQYFLTFPFTTVPVPSTFPSWIQ